MWARRVYEPLKIVALAMVVGCGGGGGDTGPDAGGSMDGGGVDAGGPVDGGADAAFDGSPDARPCTLVPEPCSAPSLLVDGDWLEARLGTDGVQVVDVRSEGLYESEHIDGALHLDAADLRATVDGVSGQVAPPDVVQSALREAGLRRDATVVTYGAARGLSAARVLWTLQLYGHPDVRRLDGGWSVWTDEGRPVESAASGAPPSDYAIDGTRGELRVEAEWLRDRLDDPDVVIVDVRSSGEYDSGHVPGAINLPWNDAVDAAGRMKSLTEVASLFEVPEGRTIVTYCTTGVRASMGYFAFRWLGHADVRVYDGSWSEWGSRSDLPKE